MAVGQDDSPGVQSLPARASFDFERVRLPGDEGMGLFGASYLVELAPGWSLGPALYGAASGRRGGLFTWGAQGERRWRLADRWGLVTGVYVGGGGGAGAPVGGGLMLRPHVDLLREFDGWATGLSLSQVSFPSGTIRSTQVGWVVEVKDKFAFAAPGHEGQRVEFAGVSGLGADRMDLTVGRYSFGAGAHSPFDSAGIRFERHLDGGLAATVEAAGAATAGAAGYAEFLGGVLALWPVRSETFHLGLRAAAGLAGGGGVSVGGGPIAKLAVLGRVELGRDLALTLETGRARAFNGSFNTAYAQVGIGQTLGADSGNSGSAPATKSLHAMEWSLSVQDYLHAARKDGSVRGLNTLGLKFQRSLNDYFYLSGQAHSAITGGAGAYSAGLIGLGTSLAFGNHSPWRVGAEALVGAAGGGGVASGGAIAQPMAWIARDLGPYSSATIGAGYVKSLRGSLSSPVIDATWTVRFGMP